MNPAVQYFIKMGYTPEQALQMAAKLYGPAVQNTIELAPAEVTRAPIQWAKPPQNPQDRAAAGRATDTTVGVLDNFGALPRSSDGVDAYWNRSRGINDVHAAANQYQPQLTADALIQFARIMGMAPQGGGYPAQAAWTEDMRRKAGVK